MNTPQSPPCQRERRLEILTGTPGSVGEKNQAFENAWVAGVQAVDMKDLNAEPWARKERGRAENAVKGDEQIAAAAMTALSQDPRVSAFTAEVSVSDGVVTLKGVVDNLQARVAAGNDATYKHPTVLAWVAKHPRFHLHFTPTSSSWLNLVERFFRDLSQDVVLPGSFTSVKGLSAAIWDHLSERNLHPTRYVWKASGQSILEKIHRPRTGVGTQVGHY